MSVLIGGRAVGDGHPCFIIAEAGSNHDGKLAQALALIDVAAAAGADAVKFQVFRVDRLYPERAGVSSYLQSPESIRELLAGLELPFDWLPELAGHCAARNICLLASAFDEQSADAVDEYVSAHKVASYELTQLPLLRHIAGKGKPMILSTGAADLGEVAWAVAELKRAGIAGGLVLMQCTAAYPAPLESLNVRAIQILKSQFEVPTGLSDHSRDPVLAPVSAVAVGANAIEKHFTLGNRLPGPDHAFALEPQELKLMVAKVREAELALGAGEKVVHAVEHELRGFARRSLFAARDIGAGESFTSSDVTILRNGELDPGLAPARLYELLDRRRARREIAAGAPIREEDLA
jgi:sialic acid synthase SpsE